MHRCVSAELFRLVGGGRTFKHTRTQVKPLNFTRIAHNIVENNFVYELCGKFLPGY